MTETKSSTFISPGLQWVARKATEHPEWVFTTLAHHIDLDLLREAFRRTRKDGAVGVDGVTAAEYEGDLEANLQSLLDRAKSGLYRAPAVRRVHIPKGDGRMRPPMPLASQSAPDRRCENLARERPPSAVPRASRESWRTTRPDGLSSTAKQGQGCQQSILGCANKQVSAGYAVSQAV